MSYIPALVAGQLRLSALTGEPQWREKAMTDLGAAVLHRLLVSYAKKL